MNTVHLMVKPEMARQGDVLIIPLNPQRAPRKEDIGDLLKEGDRLVLAYGEVTGHAHAIYPLQDMEEEIHENPEPAQLFELHNFTSYVDSRIREGMYLRVNERSLLRHEEHETISIAPGHYGVIRQTEMNNTYERVYVSD